MIPCPACDARDMGPMEALALGVALGASFGEQHPVTGLMCELHRPLFVVAMMRAAVLSNTAEEVADAGDGE